MDRAIEEMSSSELLDHVDVLATTQRRCELELLRAAVQHAVVNNPKTLDPDLTRLPGRERAVRYGGVGTEHVAEFASAEFGARIGRSAWSAHAMIADALDLVIRFPQLWERVEALEVQASYARFVARRTRHLSIAQAAYVDARVVEAAAGRIPWSRFEALVEGAVTASDPEESARVEDEAARERFAKPTSTTDEGIRGFYIRATFPVIARLDAIVAHLADLLAAQGDPDPLDARRVKAVLLLTSPAAALQLMAAHHGRDADLTHPIEPASTTPDPDPDPAVDWSALLQVVQLFVHVYAGTHTQPSEGVARVEGVGAATERWLRTHLHPHTQVKVTPVVDLEGQAPVDSYEVPDRHRRAVELMTPVVPEERAQRASRRADIFPFAPNTSRASRSTTPCPTSPAPHPAPASPASATTDR